MNEPTPEWRKAFDEWKNALDHVSYVQLYRGADTGFLAGWTARGKADLQVMSNVESYMNDDVYRFESAARTAIRLLDPKEKP